MLTPAAFLVDATHALLAGALRRLPLCPVELRHGRDFFSAKILSAESNGDADQAAWARIYVALLDARDGRLEDALAELVSRGAPCRATGLRRRALPHARPSRGGEPVSPRRCCARPLPSRV
ncbi:hypothetical protein ACP70R_037532 [Stipagrostis hirtigluma subsp. patula]